MARSPLVHLARLLPLLVLLAVAACGDDTGTNPGDDPDGPGDDDPAELDPTADPDAEDFCGLLGYFCTAGEVDDEVFERSEELLGEARGRIESGDSNDATAAWLRDQEGVDEVDATPSAVVFRVNGGQPTWLLTPALDQGAARTAGPDPAKQNVVGHGTSRANPENRKRALILMPYRFQFGSDDPGPGIYTTLRGHRDYNHGAGAELVGNANAPVLGGADHAGRPTVDDFRGWDAYDVIAVSTHGAEMGGDSFGCSLWEGDIFCVAGISTGQRVKSCSVIRKLYPDMPGLRCAGSSGVDGIYILVDTDFFAWEYGQFAAGLDKSIIYMGGCQTFKNGSMAYQLGGSRSEYFGWDESVLVSEMRAPAIRLFQLLVQEGLTTEDAFDRMESEGTTSTSRADLELRTNGDGLHIREITTLKNPMHPSVSNAPGGFFQLAGAGPADPGGPAGPRPADEEGDLEAGDILPFIGQAADGETDELFFFVDVDGVLPGEEGDFDVRVEVDGDEVGTYSLDSEEAKRIDDNTVRLKIRQPIDFDVQPGRDVTLKATTLLPGDDDGESDHEVTAVLENPTLFFTSTMESEGGDVRLFSEVEADIDLAFRENDQEELELGRSIGDLEYLRYEIEAPSEECRIETSTVDGRLEVKEGEVDFDDPGSSAFGVPDELLIFPLPEIRDFMTVHCEGTTQTTETFHWFAAFVSFHGGELGGGRNEFDESRGALVIESWQPGGADGVYARREYARTATEDEVTFREETTLELRGPRYGGE